jgi:hypothetical protein
MVVSTGVSTGGVRIPAARSAFFFLLNDIIPKLLARLANVVDAADVGRWMIVA